MFDDDLSEDQIFERAKMELHTKANSYISALSEAQLHARQIVSTEKMLDIFRQYFRPVTASRFRVADILKGSVFDYVTDSDRSVEDIPKKKDTQEVARIAEAHARVIDERKEVRIEHER